jgi:hypothetical protein
MTMEQAVTAWQSTPTTNTGSARAASRRSTWGGHAVTLLRISALLGIAILAILVLLPAAIAAQAAFAV